MASHVMCMGSVATATHGPQTSLYTIMQLTKAQKKARGNKIKGSSAPQKGSCKMSQQINILGISGLADAVSLLSRAAISGDANEVSVLL